MNNNITKKAGEDWKFFFKIQKEDETLQDLNGYTVSIVIEKTNTNEVYRKSILISEETTEVITIVPGSKTQNFPTGEVEVEYMFINPEGEKVITDKTKMQCINSLHYN